MYNKVSSYDLITHHAIIFNKFEVTQTFLHFNVNVEGFDEINYTYAL